MFKLFPPVALRCKSLIFQHFSLKWALHSLQLFLLKTWTTKTVSMCRRFVSTLISRIRLSQFYPTGIGLKTIWFLSSSVSPVGPHSIQTTYCSAVGLLWSRWLALRCRGRRQRGGKRLRFVPQVSAAVEQQAPAAGGGKGVPRELPGQAIG